jgi:hypothetical protein
LAIGISALALGIILSLTPTYPLSLIGVGLIVGGAISSLRFLVHKPI